MLRIATSTFIMITLLLCGHINTQAEEVIIGTSEFPPFISRTDSHNNYLTEVLDAVAAEMGVTFKIEFLPWKRSLHYVEEGKIWGAFPFVITPEREKIYTFSDPLYNVDVKFFYYSPDSTAPAIHYDTYSDLKPYRIGGIIGYYYVDALRKAGLDLELVSSETQNMQRLALGRVDLIPMNVASGWRIIKENFPSQVKNFGTLGRPIKTYGGRMLVSKDNPKALTRLEHFNKALKHVKETGEYQRVLDRYGLDISY